MRKTREKKKKRNAAETFDVGGISRLQNSTTLLSLSTYSSENLNLSKL
jgi:hypothetical protein